MMGLDNSIPFLCITLEALLVTLLPFGESQYEAPNLPRQCFQGLWIFSGCPLGVQYDVHEHLALTESPLAGTQKCLQLGSFLLLAGTALFDCVTPQLHETSQVLVHP